MANSKKARDAYGHEGPVYLDHRTRVRQRIERGGIASLDGVEFLEFILFYAIPRKDTKVIAYDLIRHFGSLKDVFLATQDELIDAGLSLRAAVMVSTLRVYAESYKKRYEMVENSSGRLKNVIKDLIDQYGSKLVSNHVMAVFLNTDLTVVQVKTIVENDDLFGLMNEICGCAVKNHAGFSVMIHVRDELDSFALNDDVLLTPDYYQSLRNIGVELLDRYFYSSGRYYSLREENVFFTSLQEFLDFTGLERMDKDK